MKINFRKIASVLASAVMIGSTAGIALAANYPMPFVNNGVADAAIVVGANAPLDAAAATSLQSDLNSLVTGAVSTISGDNVKIEKSSNLFSMGDNISSIYPTLSSSQLNTVLADGKYYNAGNDNFKYTQKIDMGSNLQLTFFQDDDFSSTPTIGFNLPSGTHIMNYTLDFTPDNAKGNSKSGSTGWDDIAQTDLTMMGKSYFIIDADNTTKSLTLLDTANSGTVAQNAPATIVVGGVTYTVSIIAINADDVTLKVNNVETNSLAKGDTYEIADNTYIAVKDILYGAKESETSSAKVSIGTGKISLVNGDIVQINDVDVDGLTAFISGTATTVDKVVLQWDLADDSWIAPGSDLTMPGFSAVKISMTGFNEPKQEETKLANDGDRIKLETEVTDGSVSFPILYANSSGTGFNGTGKDISHDLVTVNGTNPIGIILNASKDEYLAVGWTNGQDVESYVLKFDASSVSDSNSLENYTTLTSIASGSSVAVKPGLVDAADLGDNIHVTLSNASDILNWANISLSPIGSGTVYADRLYTAEGMMIRLPVVANSALDGYLNLTSTGAPTWKMNFTEEDQDNNIALGKSLTATISFDSTELKPHASDTSLTEIQTGDNTDKYEAYVASPLATKVFLDKSATLNELTVTYHGTEASADVYISEVGAATVTDKGILIVKDSEASSVSGKNLIVVGGSCINSVAASILGVSAGTCGEAFTAATGVGAGQYLIKSVASPLNAAKTAVLVAGYEAADTANAAGKLKDEKLSTDVGQSVNGPATA